MAPTPLRIVAPVCRAEEVETLVAAGADELYCGAMFEDWASAFGTADTMSRRQGRAAHARNPHDLAQIVRRATALGVPVALTLNARYSAAQMPSVLALAQSWEEMGGRAVLVTDFGLLLALHRRHSSLLRHLSTLAGVFNSEAVAWFAELGVSRVVLPRDLTIAQIGALVRNAPPLEYEALVLHQKCPFIDGMCNFHHESRLPADAPAEFDYAFVTGEPLPVVWADDPGYEGHGCELSWQSADGPVCLARQDDTRTPACAACLLADLSAAGLGHLKLAGRAYPTELLARSIHFIRAARRATTDMLCAHDRRVQIRQLYLETFGASCDGARCYYDAGDR